MTGDSSRHGLLLLGLEMIREIRISQVRVIGRSDGHRQEVNDRQARTSVTLAG